MNLFQNIPLLFLQHIRLLSETLKAIPCHPDKAEN